MKSSIKRKKNQVDCEDCGEKKDARMRTCLEHLPNLLIVHLKRFELDYRTFETVKLNDRCSFPMLLDLKPYTMKGTDERWGGVELEVNLRLACVWCAHAYITLPRWVCCCFLASLLSPFVA